MNWKKIAKHLYLENKNLALSNEGLVRLLERISLEVIGVKQDNWSALPQNIGALKARMTELEKIIHEHLEKVR